MPGNGNVVQQFVDPRAQALMSQTAHMDIAQKYLFAMANRIAPQQLGLTPGQIYASEQGLAGYTMNRQTGVISDQMGQPVNPGSLMSTMNTNLGGNIYAGQGSGAGTSGTFNPSGWGSNPNIAPMGSGLAGGTGGGGSAPGSTGTNPYGGAAGLAGSGGNALRQQLMDSGQFNPNGSNTYAIQNMDLSGQGASVGQAGQADPGVVPPGTTPTAQGTVATTGTPMPTATGAPTPAPTSTPNPYRNTTGQVPGYNNGQTSGAIYSTAPQASTNPTPAATTSSPTATTNPTATSNPYTGPSGTTPYTRAPTPTGGIPGRATIQ